MPEYKKQHFIAENYLKGFSRIDYFTTVGANYPIWIYDIEKKSLKFRSPHNIAWRPYYYSSIDENGEYEHKLEKDFSKLEGLINILIRRIDSNIRHIRKREEIKPLTEDDRMLLIHFIYWHMKKIPSVVDNIHSEVSKMFTEIAQRYESTFSEAVVKNATLEIMRDIGTRPEYDYVKALLQKNCRIAFLSNDDTSFITTDNPVVRFNKTDTNGIAKDSTEIYFPLNQRCIVFLHGNGDKFEYLRLSNRKYLFEHNKFVASNARYIIIGRDREYLIKILNSLKYEISNIV